MTPSRRAPHAPTGHWPSEALLARTVPAPVIVGTGLIALDVIYGPDEGTEPLVAAGGTCGNVLAALSYLGWDAYPVARLSNDGSAGAVREDLVRWGVKLDFLSIPPTMATPVIVQRIRRDASDRVFHKFSLSCEECGRWLPTYAAVPAAAMSQMLSQMPVPEVCFVDRSSRGAVLLAEWAASQGSLVYIEPSGRSTSALLGKLLTSAHIVKYSADHRELVTEARRYAGRAFNPWLEVETQGAGGLRYRTRTARTWKTCAALQIPRVRDTAGAGDWCTVGILHMMAQGGAAALEHIPGDVLHEAIFVGQALSAWTCQHEGARGGMNATSPAQLSAAVERAWRRDASLQAGTVAQAVTTRPSRLALCRDCKDPELVTL